MSVNNNNVCQQCQKVNYYFNLNSRNIRNSMMQQHNQYSQQLQHASSSIKTKQQHQQASPTAGSQPVHQAQATLNLLNPQHQQPFLGQNHLRKLANATFSFKGTGGTTMGNSMSGLTQAQMAMASKLVTANTHQAQMNLLIDEGASQSQSYRQTFQNTGLLGMPSGNDFSAENASSSTKSIPVGKKQGAAAYSNVNVISGRRGGFEEQQNVSASKKKISQFQSVSGAMSLKISKKQGLTLNTAVGSTSTHTGKTTGSQTSTHGNNLKYQGMKTAGAIMTGGSVRDLSANSDKGKTVVPNPPPITNSLLKQKSRNRCNENLNIGGAPGTGSGVGVSGPGVESRGSSNHINNNHSNIETAYQSHAQILSSGNFGSGLLPNNTPHLPQESNSHGDLRPQAANARSIIANTFHPSNNMMHNNKNIHDKESSKNNNAHSNFNSSQRIQHLLVKNPEARQTENDDVKNNSCTLSLDRSTVPGQSLNYQTVKIAHMNKATSNNNTLDTSVGNSAQLISKKKIIVQGTTVQDKLLISKGIKQLFKGNQEKTSTPTYQGSSSLNASGGFTQSLERHQETLSVDESLSLSNRAPVNNQQFEKSPTINQKTRQISRINNSKLIKGNPDIISKNIQNTSSHALNIMIQDSQGVFLQSERAAYLGSKLSLSHEYANSARECEMSTTINYTHATTGLNLHPEEQLASQTMIMESQSPGGEGGSACSPQNQSTGKINFYPASKNSSGILKRRTPASSQHIVSQHAPNQAKRKHQAKAESCHQRIISDDPGTSSPSGGAQNLNNVSSSQGNKSQHYGLSSQSFLTNSNSNGGSNTRAPAGTQAQDAVGPQQVQTGPGSSGVNTSSISSSFFNHQRQKSGGGFTTALSNLKTSTKKTNSSLQPQAAHNIGINSLQGTNIIFRGSNQIASSKKAIVGQHDTDMKAAKSNHHSTLSQTKIDVNEMLSLSQRVITTGNQHHPILQQTSSGQVMLKNSSKTGLKVDSNKRGDTSSRSNSIRKTFNQAIIKSGSKKALKNNFITSTNNQSENKALFQQQSPDHEKDSQKARNNRHVYNHTVEDLDNVDSLDHSLVQASFSKDAQPPSIHSSNLKQSAVKVKTSKKDIMQSNLNRSVVVEPSSSQMNNSLIKLVKKRPEASGAKAKHQQQSTQNMNVQEYEIFEVMKNELKNKDMMIQNLKDRLLDLEDKVNGIQQQQERHGRNRNEELKDEDSQKARDKSQQRIKEAIINLERKLEQFRMEKELNNLRVDEMKQYSSSQHSSSRQSDLLMNQRSHQTQQYLQTMLDSGLIHPVAVGPFALAQGRTPQYNLPTTSSNDGGFATHTLGAPRRRQKSRTSLIEDLESLITIAEKEDLIAAGGANTNLAALQNQLFYQQRGSQGLLNAEREPRNKKFNKIKTPMFEDDIAKLCESSSEDDNKNLQADESHLKIIAQGGDLILDEDEEGQDNSCLLMLEKEWQEAQRQKLRDEEVEVSQNNFLNGSGGNNNISKIFDQSLISSSNQAMMHHNNPNNYTQGNIVFYLNGDETLQQDGDDDEEIERDVEHQDELALLARGGKEKFIKTQKIEFSHKERTSLITDAGSKRQRQLQKGDSSLSPSSNTGTGGGMLIPMKKLKAHLNSVKQQEDGTNNEGQSKFSRTHSKTQLLEKIKNAFVKGEKGLVLQAKKSSPSKKSQHQQHQANPPQRLLVKRSLERTITNAHTVKMKNIITSQKKTDSEAVQQESEQPRQGGLQQQEMLMKTIVQQKEKIAQTQKEALKKEREISLELRQAINKLNLQTQLTAATGSVKKQVRPSHQQK